MPRLQITLVVLELCQLTLFDQSKGDRRKKRNVTATQSTSLLQPLITRLGEEGFGRLCILSIFPHLDGLRAIFTEGKTVPNKQALIDVYPLVAISNPANKEDQKIFLQFLHLMTDDAFLRELEALFATMPT